MNYVRRLFQILTGRLKTNDRPPSTTSAENRESDGTLVEFVYGPLDGHREYLDESTAGQLMAVVEIPITAATVEGFLPSPAAPISSIAVYERLGAQSHYTRYQFCGSAAPERKVTIRDWNVS